MGVLISKTSNHLGDHIQGQGYSCLIGVLSTPWYNYKCECGNTRSICSEVIVQTSITPWGAIITRTSLWPWKSRLSSYIFNMVLFPTPCYIFCVNLVNGGWGPRLEQTRCYRWTDRWMDGQMDWHIDRQTQMTTIQLQPQGEGWNLQADKWVGNFHVNPRFHPAGVGWNWGLRWKFPPFPITHNIMIKLSRYFTYEICAACQIRHS